MSPERNIFDDYLGGPKNSKNSLHFGLWKNCMKCDDVGETSVCSLWGDWRDKINGQINDTLRGLSTINIHIKIYVLTITAIVTVYILFTLL